jgi:hypothetical protein
MKYRFYLLLPALLICLSAQSTLAADAKNSYLIMGPGSYTCDRIVSDLATDAKSHNPASIIVDSNWLAGNLTSYNRDTKGTYSVLGNSSFDEAFAWVVQYCQDNPDQIYAGAVDALVQKLKPHRFTVMQNPVPKKNDDDDKDDGK